MVDDVITPETLSTDLVRGLLDAAYMDYQVDEQGNIRLRDGFSYWLVVETSEAPRFVRVLTVFSFKEEASESQRLALANRINDQVITIRAAASGDRLALDQYLAVEGGVTPRHLMLSLRGFKGLVEAALARNSEGILQ